MKNSNVVCVNLDEIFLANNEVQSYIDKCNANINCPYEILIAQTRSKLNLKDEEFGSDDSLATDALEIAERCATMNMRRRKKSILDAEEGMALKRSKSEQMGSQESPFSSIQAIDQIYNDSNLKNH